MGVGKEVGKGVRKAIGKGVRKAIGKDDEWPSECGWLWRLALC